AEAAGRALLFLKAGGGIVGLNSRATPDLSGAGPSCFHAWTAVGKECYDCGHMAGASHCAHVLTVLNLKGGVGKTHSVWLLASVCQEQSLRVLLVDTDTQ